MEIGLKTRFFVRKNSQLNWKLNLGIGLFETVFWDGFWVDLNFEMIFKTVFEPVFEHRQKKRQKQWRKNSETRDKNQNTNQPKNYNERKLRNPYGLLPFWVLWKMRRRLGASHWPSGGVAHWRHSNRAGATRLSSTRCDWQNPRLLWCLRAHASRYACYPSLWFVLTKLKNILSPKKYVCRNPHGCIHCPLVYSKRAISPW